MKKIILFTLTTLLLFNCSNNEHLVPTIPLIPCKDENCLTDVQLEFFKYYTNITTKKELYETTTLDLSNKSITSLDTGIFNNLTKLTELFLNDNNLTSIPTDIGNLTSLTNLRLQNNDLTSLPDGIFNNLTSLTDLDFRGNKLPSLPDGIFTNLTSLTRLRLKDSTSSDEMNSFDCNDTNYMDWGLTVPITITSFECNN